MKIGVLAIQGDFEQHRKVLDHIGIDNFEVRFKEDLDLCDGLIIPGGESTTILKLLNANNLFQLIQQFGQHKIIMGTCAGTILLANSVVNSEMKVLQLIDIEVCRNAYGRQINSFVDDIRVNLNKKEDSIEGVFIRAPKIIKTGKGVRPLGFHGKDIVLAENSKIIVATFHPELSNNDKIHKYFISKVRNNN